MPKNFFALLILLFTLSLLNSSAIYADTANSGQAGPSSPSSSLINQAAEQNMAESSSVFAPLGQLLNGIGSTISSSETYQSLQQFWYNDIAGGFFNGIVQAISQFFNNLCNLYLPAIITCLCNAIEQFFLNIDLTQIQNSSAQSNDLAFMLKQFYDTMLGIALDLSLLLFILSIWRYWVDAAWKGSNSLMSAVGRLIFTIGLILAWPTIYSFQIQLSNELMNALFMDGSGNIQFLNLAMARLFNLSTIQSLFSKTGLVLISILGGASDVVAIVAAFVFVFLAIIVICQLLYAIILKAIQTALMTAQYVFAPIFLVLLANPVTDGIATSYIRTFVEVSLWNFIWIGLLKILIILLYSDINPWTKILAAIGILQIMLDVPQFLAHAKISVASDYVSPHFFVKSLKDISQYDKKIHDGIQVLQLAFGKKNDNKNEKTQDQSSLETKGNDLNFADNNNGISNFAPPVTKLNSKNDTESTPHSQGETGPRLNTANGSTGAFAAGAGASTSNAQSSSNTTNGTAVAVSSSTSNALALATASINNNSGTNSAPPKKPGPSGPGPKPNSPNDPSPSPSSGPNPNGGPNPDPNLGPNFGPNSGPNNGPGSSPNFYSGQNPNRGPNLGSNFDPNPGPGSALNLGPHPNSSLGPSFKPNPALNSPVNLGTGTNSTPTIAENESLKSTSYNKENYITIEKPPTRSKPTSVDLSIDKQAPNNNFIGDPAPIFNQLYAFHTGAMNYHLQKSKTRSAPFIRTYFPPFNKTCSKCNASSSGHSNDLIFSHGNSPTLMGIPPIYPGAH